MKRIKTVNGYAIYQAVSERDAENYSCAVGSYNLYLATDVRDYGLFGIPNDKGRLVMAEDGKVLEVFDFAHEEVPA